MGWLTLSWSDLLHGLTSQSFPGTLIPAKAGIQIFRMKGVGLDSRLRGNDEKNAGDLDSYDYLINVR